MNEQQMIASLADLPKGSVVFVSYVAGRPPTMKAVAEAADHPGPRRYLTGEFQEMWITKKGETVFTVLAYNRSHFTADGVMDEGGYRTINPRLGRLLHLEVISRAEPTENAVC